jgi:hypothetical protein
MLDCRRQGNLESFSRHLKIPIEGPTKQDDDDQDSNEVKQSTPILRAFMMYARAVARSK